jgi:hypothetical protein
MRAVILRSVGKCRVGPGAAAAVVLCLRASAQQAASPLDEVNRQLPAWLRFSGEYRLRLEGYTGGGFQDGSSDTYLLHRLRLDMEFLPRGWWRFHVQAQDARAFWRNTTPPPYQDTMDLRMAYMELGNAEKSVGLRAGRQELNFGDQRLVGSSNWTNTARTFDAVRLRLRSGGYRLDAFASTVVQQVDGSFDRPFRVEADNLHGLYGGIEKAIPKAVWEPYLFWHVTRNLRTEAGRPGNRDFKTAGVRGTGTLPLRFDYNLEMAWQIGSLGTDQIRAWAGHWQTGYTLPGSVWKPRLIAEYNFASGDRNPHDGLRGTFDVMYPTGHDKTGLADQVGWKNIHDLRAGIQLRRGTGWLIAPIYHSYWLASPADALYTSSGTAIAQKPDGSAGTRVGQEADISVLYTPNQRVTAGAGFAHLFPGEFLKKATPGHGYSFPYVMLGYSF